MENYKSLAYSRYDCKYHIVFVPKFRKKTLYGRIRQYLKGVFHELAKQKGWVRWYLGIWREIMYTCEALSSPR
jgi:putative transposase